MAWSVSEDTVLGLSGNHSQEGRAGNSLIDSFCWRISPPGLVGPREEFLQHGEPVTFAEYFSIKKGKGKIEYLQANKKGLENPLQGCGKSVGRVGEKFGES